MPTFDGKSENFELFDDLLQKSLKIQNQLTEENKTKQNKLLPLSYARWCAANIQKHHQPQQREFGENSDCVP